MINIQLENIKKLFLQTLARGLFFVIIYLSVSTRFSPSMPYQILSHTADVRLRVSGQNYEELFQAAFLGIEQILKEKEVKALKKTKRLIKISSVDPGALLVDFLNKVLYENYTRKEIYSEVKFKKLLPTLLVAEIFGSPIEKFDEDIKAATYHEMEIKKRADGFLETIIIFDI